MERRACVCILIAMLFSPEPGAAQVEIPAQAPPEYSSTLFLDPLAFLGPQPGQTRLDVFVQVGYDNLSFLKTGDTYGASYEIAIAIDDSTGAGPHAGAPKSWPRIYEICCKTIRSAQS